MGYVKIPTDFFESDTIKAIEEMPNSDELIVLYLHLLCEANKKSRKGRFEIAGIELTDNVLEYIFQTENISAKLEVLEKVGLVERKTQSIRVFKFWADLHDRSSDRYREWRNAVFKRDGFRCVHCGTKKDLQAHHTKSWKDYKELRYDVANGVTLCRACHLKAHGGCWRG